MRATLCYVDYFTSYTYVLFHVLLTLQTRVFHAKQRWVYVLATINASAFQLAMRAGVAGRAAVFPLAMRAAFSCTSHIVPPTSPRTSALSGQPAPHHVIVEVHRKMVHGLGFAG